MSYQRPDNLGDAMAILANGDWTVLAGGTDIFPALVDRPPPAQVLDISAIDDLKNIEERSDHWFIGAGVRWSDILKADLPSGFDGLKMAAREVGASQIQNAATVVGNLCNASPAADGVPPLLTMNAEVLLRRCEGERSLSIPQFILGNRRTALNKGELAVGLRIPKSATAGSSGFLKIGARKYLVISIVMVAGRLAVNDAGNIESAAFAVGACSEVAQRLPALEEKLCGRRADASCLEVITTAEFAGLSPIDDVRADKTYRREAARHATRRLLQNLIAGQ